MRAVRAMAFARFDIKALAGGCQVFCVCGFVGFGSQAQGLIMQRCVGEVVLDEPGFSVGYAILYAPRHDVLNTASLGAYFSLIIACFSVLKHDVLNAASLGEVCCHVLLLNQE